MAISSRALGQLAPLVVPPIVSLFALDPHQDTGSVTLTLSLLAALATITIGGLVVRATSETRSKDPWAVLGVLTANGRNMMWTSTLALCLGSSLDWASLHVIGLLGMGTVYLAVAWITLVGMGDRPWRYGKVSRSVVPEMTSEGDPLRDEIRLTNLGIAPGLRLFVYAETCPHGAIVRHVVGSSASRSSIELHADIGFATRGVHVVKPFSMWFSDVLGLVRSPTMPGMPTTWTVMPRPATVDNTSALVGLGRDAVDTVATERLPTEGTFRIRDYAPGDDARRIHWVRSLQANRLVVRLPDEIPIGEPAVRVVLDSQLADDSLRCRGHHELLDSLVRTWLGVGEALAATGVRVTMAAAIRTDDGFVPAFRPLQPRASREATRLGARAAWQSKVDVADLMSRDGVRQVVVSACPRRIEGISNVAWIIMPEVVWAHGEEVPETPTVLTLPFEMGDPDNRRDRQRRERDRLDVQWADRITLSTMISWPDWSEWSGAYVARRNGERTYLEVVP